METSSQLHLGIVHVRTVLQQRNPHTSRELGRQRLLSQRRTAYLLARLSDEQRKGILRRTNLTTEVVGLRQGVQISSLSTLHIGRARPAQLMLELHHLPSLLGHLGHLCHDAHLLVQHQQRIVAVGNTTDDLCPDSHLIVLEAQEFHLG